MNRNRTIIPFLFFVIGVVMFAVSCNRLTIQLDQGWTLPIGVTSSIDSLVSGTDLYKSLGKAIALRWQDTSEKCFILERNDGGGNYWKEAPSQDIPKGYSIPPTVEESGGRILFPKNKATSDQMIIGILLARIKEDGRIQIEPELKWTISKQTFFGEAGTNVSLNMAGFGNGSIYGQDIYLPYCMFSETLTDAVRAGPFDNGVFHSTNSGETWQIERISVFEAGDPTVCRTKDCYYYFATRGLNNGYELWFSRKSNEGNSWSTPTTTTKTFAVELGRYDVVAEGDTVHVCWMDRRHNKWRFDLSGPAIENDDIYYSHRKDSDSDWGKDVLLSKGVEYCYAPSISAEGNKVVVAWAGIPSAGKYHTDYDPNDIFYVTSGDGGKTWTRPLKVTDGAKDGMTAGHPEVMLLNGVIHLFYIQGKMNLQQVGGLTKLNQPPWPIYYTERPFPN